jgi:hypothetical protein
MNRQHPDTLTVAERKRRSRRKMRGEIVDVAPKVLRGDSIRAAAVSTGRSRATVYRQQAAALQAEVNAIRTSTMPIRDLVRAALVGKARTKAAETFKAKRAADPSWGKKEEPRSDIPMFEDANRTGPGVEGWEGHEGETQLIDGRISPLVNDAWAADRAAAAKSRQEWFSAWFKAWIATEDSDQVKRSRESNKTLMEAALAGVEAFEAGLPESECPYQPPIKTSVGRIVEVDEDGNDRLAARRQPVSAYNLWRKGWQEARDRSVRWG